MNLITSMLFLLYHIQPFEFISVQSYCCARPDMVEEVTSTSFGSTSSGLQLQQI
jgi:hypothetical protein